MQKRTSKELGEKTDEEIAIAVQKGQHDDFAILAQRYTQKLTKYTLRYVGTQDAAHDIIQDVMIKAHQKINTFDATRKFSPWIYRIAHNESVNYLKKHRSHTKVSLDTQLSLDDQRALADVELSSLDAWFERELKEQMHEAIGQLPDHYAEVIHLRYIEELSYKEIAEILDKPTSTVGTLVRRAKKDLLEIILKQNEER